MASRISTFRRYVALVGLVWACADNSGLAEDNVSYSGKYLLAAHDAKSDTDVVLEVVQNQDAVEVQR